MNPLNWWRPIVATVALLSASSSLLAHESKEYVVFVGVSPLVQHGTEMRPVIDARRETVEVVADGRLVSLPTASLAAVETTAEPKVSAIQIALDNVRTEPGYVGLGPESDKDRQQLILNILAAERQTQAMNNWKSAYSNHRLAQTAAAHGVGSQAQVREAEANLGVAESSFDQTVVEGMQWESAHISQHPRSQGFNALIYSAQVSAPTEITGAYGMLRLLVRDPANPHSVLSTVRFTTLPRLGPKPQTFRSAIGISNLPDGFAVEECTFHIFVGGRELATSASRNRAQVTLSEAHQFLLFRHITENRVSSLPPMVVPELVSPGLAAKVPQDLRWVTIDFAIDRDGAVVDLNPTPAAPPLSPDLTEELRSLRFYPALANGAPIDSRGTFALSEFVR